MNGHIARTGRRAVGSLHDCLPHPVPVAELHVQVRTVRSGGRTELVEGELTANGETVMLARAWRMAAGPADTPQLRPEAEPPPLPGPQTPHTMAGTQPYGYIAAMEWRFEPGKCFDTPDRTRR
ncbi:acyl-CoA thioesterase domain-containing protein [Streptomyces sp. Ac-502]|uniref:acyl-CoA thioesterase domain-containing protein n=1 Tax=Streptomyces sp. Ac-502 TaxID=3342801 RepID=UPI003862AD22